MHRRIEIDFDRVDSYMNVMESFVYLDDFRDNLYRNHFWINQDHLNHMHI